MSQFMVRVHKVGEWKLNEKQYSDLMKCFAHHELIGYQDGASREGSAEIIEVAEMSNGREEQFNRYLNQSEEQADGQ